jgi:hypothetical protein
MFVQSMKINYPEYHVKIFGHGFVDYDVFKYFDQKQYQYLTGSFQGWVYRKWEPISWRFLVNPKYYAEYDYVYVGDIDLIITREKVTLLNFHLNEMGETGLTYSNSLRNSKHWKGCQSLTGLHFASRKWFEQTEKARQKYAALVKAGREGDKREYDGHMLYLMCKESGLNTPKKYPLIERHHGLHAGSFKLMSRNAKLKKRLGIDKCRIWAAMCEKPEFQEALAMTKRDKWTAQQVGMLDNFCKKRLK